LFEPLLLELLVGASTGREHQHAEVGTVETSAWTLATDASLILAQRASYALTIVGAVTLDASLDSHPDFAFVDNRTGVRKTRDAPQGAA
jgi:hypothetical protein